MTSGPAPYHLPHDLTSTILGSIGGALALTGQRTPADNTTCGTAMVQRFAPGLGIHDPGPGKPLRRLARQVSAANRTDGAATFASVNPLTDSGPALGPRVGLEVVSPTQGEGPWNRPAWAAMLKT